MPSSGCDRCRNGAARSARSCESTSRACDRSAIATRLRERDLRRFDRFLQRRPELTGNALPLLLEAWPRARGSAITGCWSNGAVEP